jgi:hypothetical protein
MTLVVHGNRLIAGGAFTTIDGATAKNVAAWDGNAWTPLGNGLGGTYEYNGVYSLGSHGDTLVASGNFSDPVSELARWDGVSWRNMGSNYGIAWTFAEVDGQLFAGGWWRDQNFRLDGIRRWNGAEWVSLGSGTNATVRAILGMDHRVYVGGEFSQAGGKSSFGIARWDGLVTPPPPQRRVSLAPGVPNPFELTTTISFRLAETERVRIAVLDLGGREVAVLIDGMQTAGPHSVTWEGRDQDGRTLPAGVYFVRAAVSGAVDQVRKLVRLR